MAGPWYVDSAAGGTNSGTSANPWLSINSVTAANGVAAGDTVYISDRHAETQGSALSFTVPGTLAAPNIMLCTDHTKWPTPGSGDLKTTATITTTGAFALTANGSFYCYGVTFSAGSGATTVQLKLCGTAQNWQSFKSCALVKAGTTAQTNSITTASNTTVILDGTTVQFGNTGDGLSPLGLFIWKNTPTAIAGATIPTNLFAANAANGNYLFDGVDLSALGSGKNIFAALANVNTYARLLNCKLGSSVTVAAAPANPSNFIDVVSCDSGATIYREERYKYQGTQTVETTIVRTGGASDGTTPISWKLVTTANSKWVSSFDSHRMAIWCDTTGSHTVTIYGTTTVGGVPNDDDIWIDVLYFGDTLTPQGSIATTNKANFLVASGATNNTSDASTWGGTGAGNGFKMVTPTFTVNMKGYLYVTVNMAKATSTYYIDPLVVVG